MIITGALILMKIFGIGLFEPSWNWAVLTIILDLIWMAAK